MICIIVPVKKLERTKSRLADLLDIDERIKLSLYLLEDLLRVIDSAGIFETIVVGSDDEVRDIAKEFNARFVKDESKGVNEAVRLTEDYAEVFEASLVIPIDLILLEPIDLIMLDDITKDMRNGIILTPSNRLDGTNLLLRKPALVMDTYYDMDSYLLHINKALAKGLEVKILLNDRLVHDLDSIDDIEYVMRYENGKKSIRYLRSL